MSLEIIHRIKKRSVGTQCDSNFNMRRIMLIPDEILIDIFQSETYCHKFDNMINDIISSFLFRRNNMSFTKKAPK